jgi:hypothetical protein
MRTSVSTFLLSAILLAFVPALAQSTWQRTYDQLQSATAVVPDFSDGYIIGGTLSNGNGVIMKIDEDGNELWRTEIPSEKGLFIRDVVVSKEDRSYYLVGAEGYTKYVAGTSYFPGGSYWKQAVTGVIGKMSEQRAMVWMKKGFKMKGSSYSSPLKVKLLNNSIMVTGYGTDGKQSLDSFMAIFQKSDGKLIKELKVDGTMHDTFTDGKEIMALIVKRAKGYDIFEVMLLDESLKQLNKTSSEKIALSNIYSYPVHLLPVNESKFTCAYVHFFGTSSVQCACFPIFANYELSIKAHEITPDHCNSGCYMLSHSMDRHGNFILAGTTLLSTADIYKESRMLWIVYANDYTKGRSQSYSYAEINKEDLKKYPNTVGYDISPTREGGSIMVGFATNIGEENKGTFNERKAWVIKVNENGAW